MEFRLARVVLFLSFLRDRGEVDSSSSFSFSDADCLQWWGFFREITCVFFFFYMFRVGLFFTLVEDSWNFLRRLVKIHVWIQMENSWHCWSFG